MVAIPTIEDEDAKRPTACGKRQAAAAFLVVPAFIYKLAREKQPVQQRGTRIHRRAGRGNDVNFRGEAQPMINRPRLVQLVA